MSLLWKNAYDVSKQPGAHMFAPVDDGDVFRHEIHQQHSLHPWLRDAGFMESPCGYPGCPEYSEHHSDMMDQAFATPGKVETHEPGSVKLHGMEKHIDPGAVLRYMNHPPDKAPPKVFTYGGEHHILDGHHRLLADTLAGRPLTFEHAHLED